MRPAHSRRAAARRGRRGGGFVSCGRFYAFRPGFVQLKVCIDLPAFHTAVAASRIPAPEGRVVVPLRDPEATATYHFVCRADHAEALAPVFDALPAP